MRGGGQRCAWVGGRRVGWGWGQEVGGVINLYRGLLLERDATRGGHGWGLNPKP